MSFISNSFASNSLPTSPNITLPTDPKVIGPGVWFTIHRTAKRATNESGKKCFVELMNDLAEKFPCPKCRNHIQKYLSENPIKNYWNLRRKNLQTGQGGNADADEEIGMFTWAWNFHNAVNSRLSAAGQYKPYVDFDTAWNLYSDSGISVCTKGCGEESETAQTSQPAQTAQVTQPMQPSQNIYPTGFGQQPLMDDHRLQPSLLKALSPSLFS